MSSHPEISSSAPKSARLMSSGLQGVLAGLCAQSLWGVAVAFWPLLRDMPSVSIMAHRMIWSCVFMAIILQCSGRWGEVLTAVRNKRTFAVLAFNAALLACNWSIFLWGVNSGRTVECSLGYFMNPLLNVLVGRIMLGERISKAQALAVLLAAIGVTCAVLTFGAFPWLGLTLAVSFAIYGYLQKTIRVEAAPSLFVETACLVPVGLIWLAFAHPGTLGFLGQDWSRQLMLMSTVLFTGFPLLLYSFAARHMQLSALGIMQYLSPTMNVLVALLINGESLKSADKITFPFILAALLIYTWDALRRLQQVKHSHASLVDEKNGQA